MSRYDWSWNRPYDRGFGPRPMRGYGPGFGDHERSGGRGGGGWWGNPAPSWQWGNDAGRGWPAPRRGAWQQPRYDRGEYGDSYPAYGGYPGDDARGMYYGGDRYDRGFAPRGGNWGQARGYDQGMVREPFIPEGSPHQSEREEQPHHPLDPWASGEQAGFGPDLSDDEIRSAVRQNLFNDSWIDADRVNVEVSEQVVTLTGEVDDYLEARYAWDDAWEAVGVRGVINQLAVRSQPSDQAEKRTPAKAKKSTK